MWFVNRSNVKVVWIFSNRTLNVHLMNYEFTEIIQLFKIA
ncbi:MAG: hypothetical protein ACD_3C00081G0007 [uncultured bacterium (gcode 4)]|uniref:Uncharacterized protein n=1 Tax=uncultured bacterium (gcode 4) TaxID=1234023 RepID=K2GXX2_9BACT|nr:MAG: hypothetical protein ACD_3C00081G0007 [uncultured bacterium (gcode 4)]